MNKKGLYYLAAGVGAGVLIALAAIFITFSLYAENGRASSLPASAVPVPRVVQDVSSRTSEGFQVHGHWTLEIREPNGTLVNQREFDNDLLIDGRVALSGILARNKTLGNWRVKLFTPSTPDDIKTCERPQTIQVSETVLCIAEPSESDTDPRISKTLTVEEGVFKVVLSGDGLAQLSGGIEGVSADLKLCDSSQSPDDCASPDIANQILGFTFTTIDPPEPVEEGQQIIATVEISFE